MIKPLSEVELKESISDESVSHVFVIAPNYEERSVGASELLDRLLIDNQMHANVGVFQITLQSPRSMDVLDRIKAVNRNYSKDLLGNRVNFVSERVRKPMPEQTSIPLMTKIRKLCEATGRHVRLYLDVSAIPRTVLLKILDTFLGDWKFPDGVMVGRHSVIESIAFIYTPALSYPRTHDADVLGAVRGRYTQSPLHEMVSSDKGRVDVSLCLSGTPHEVAQTLATLPITGGPSDGVILRPLVYITQNNFDLSYKKFGSNLWAIRELRDRSVSLAYTFGISHVAETLDSHAQQAAMAHIDRLNRDPDDKSLFLIGGFGPKPVGLCAYLAKKRYDAILSQRGIMDQSDVLVMDGSQYTSIYSVGKGIAQMYVIDVERVLANPT